MADIQINYPLVISKAKKIEELSENVRRVSEKLRLLREDTEGYWRGEAADAYRVQCEDLERYILKVENKMDTLASAIIRIANLIKEADEATARAAANLSAGK